MALQGPCLAHCYRCTPPTVVLASLALAYALASVGYLALTRNLGTPFRDSLTTAQLEILRRAKIDRRRAFETSLMFSLVMIAVWKPFSSSR